MDTYTWNERFNVGDREIDKQHRLFLQYVNDCHDAACRYDQKHLIGATIYNLEMYASTHFNYEEARMKEMGYPELERHMQEHAYFKKQLRELIAAHADEKKTSTIESLLGFMRDWFLVHILEHDKKLAASLL